MVPKYKQRGVIKLMKKKRVNKGCEWESPTYRQIISEINSGKELVILNEYKTKSGKRSK